MEEAMEGAAVLSTAETLQGREVPRDSALVMGF